MSNNGPFQDVLDEIARLVGGTAVDSANKPGLYSGQIVGDGSGVQGIAAAYSKAPEVVGDTPAVLVLPGQFRSVRGQPEVNTDNVRLLVMVARFDSPAALGMLTPFRDSLPAVFDAHMTLNNLCLEAHIDSGRAGTTTWGDTQYVSWDMTLRVEIAPFKTYVS